jgi:cytochrome c556
MKAFFCGGAGLAVLLVAALVSSTTRASSDDEVPSIKKVMKKLNQGKTAPINKVKAALKKDTPEWDSVKKEAKEIAKLGAALPKNDPPRGEKGSYETLAKAFAAAGKSLEESAEKEDLDGSRAALKKISGSCMPCHQSHKPQ